MIYDIKIIKVRVVGLRNERYSKVERDGCREYVLAKLPVFKGWRSDFICSVNYRTGE